ncbi:MAG: hypothetical protein H8D23_37385 [Candidatus Brocadiales bacterium]|nr:hypothetical protein [Candidatus Brocadiales bacterium]
MKILLLTGFLFMNISLLGCASIYTSINQNKDGSYTLTKTEQGFMSLTGSVLNCKEINEQSMLCTEIDGL